MRFAEERTLFEQEMDAFYVTYPVDVSPLFRMGKAPADRRLYVGGGCQENMLQNTETNRRASIYLNLAHVFLMGFLPEQWKWFTERESIEILPYAGSPSFDELRRRFLVNLEAVASNHIDARDSTEQEGWWWNPCPLHSSTWATRVGQRRTADARESRCLRG